MAAIEDQRPARPRVDAVSPGESSQSLCAFAVPLARLPPDGDALEAQLVGRFIECGDPHYSFSRVYCDACGHDYLLAYSCKTSFFCPS